MGQNVFNLEIDDTDRADIENSVKGFFDKQILNEDRLINHIVSMHTGTDNQGRKQITIYYGEHHTRIFTWLGDNLANGHARLSVF